MYVHRYVCAWLVLTYCACRKMNIFLHCDNGVPIDNPDFKYDGENDNFVYVRKYMCVCVFLYII